MISNSIDSFLQEFETFKANFSARAKEKLKEVFNLFWEQNPGVNTVIWAQYAPYFNDGDACIFSVRSLSFTNATEEADLSDVRYGEYNGENKDIWALEDYEYSYNRLKEEGKMEGVNFESIKELSRFICSDAMEDVLKATFGSDNIIYATRAGFKSEDYGSSHD